MACVFGVRARVIAALGQPDPALAQLGDGPGAVFDVLPDPEAEGGSNTHPMQAADLGQQARHILDGIDPGHLRGQRLYAPSASIRASSMPLR